jgi:hypothetical protein
MHAAPGPPGPSVLHTAVLFPAGVSSDHAQLRPAPHAIVNGEHESMHTPSWKSACEISYWMLTHSLPAPQSASMWQSFAQTGAFGPTPTSVQNEPAAQSSPETTFIVHASPSVFVPVVAKHLGSYVGNMSTIEHRGRAGSEQSCVTVSHVVAASPASAAEGVIGALSAAASPFK